MKKSILAIFGSGGQGKEVKELADLDNAKNKKWNEIIFVDDVQDEGFLMGIRKIHLNTAIEEYGKESLEFAVALGEPSSKKKVFDLLKAKGLHFTNVISPEATISPYAELGKGLIIKKDALISPEAQIGDNTTLQSFVAVGHGVIIGKHGQVATHSVIGGETKIGTCVYIGLNVPIKEKLYIGDNAVISAGSVVLKDVPADTTVMGNPARVIAKHKLDSKVFSEREGFR